MSWLDIFRVGTIKRDLAIEKARSAKLAIAGRELKAKYEALEEKLSSVERMEALGLQASIAKLKTEKDTLQTKVDGLSNQVQALDSQIIQLDETILMQSFGIYETRYDLEESSLYKARLDAIRAEQKRMVKDNTAAKDAL